MDLSDFFFVSRAWQMEKVIKFRERSGSYSGYKIQNFPWFSNICSAQLFNLKIKIASLQNDRCVALSHIKEQTVKLVKFGQMENKAC